MTTRDPSALPFFGLPFAVALAVFAVAALASATVVWKLEQRGLNAERMRIGALASDHAHAIQAAMDRALSATYSIAAMVRQGKGNVPDFEGVATEMLPWYPGVSSMALSPGGVVRRVAPLHGNEKSLGFEQLQDPEQGREARLARDTGKLTLAGPLQLVQGGLAVVGRLPIFLDAADGRPVFWGLTSVVIRFPQALSSVRLTQLTEGALDYSLWRINPDTGARQVIVSSSDTLVDPVERSLTVPNGQWMLGVAPHNGWGNPTDLAIKIALGLAFSLMLAYASKLLVELKAHEKGQESLIAQRTMEIAASQNKLKATLEAIPDVMLEMGLDGTYHDYHAPRSNTSFPPAEFFLGKNVANVLPADAAQEVMAALQEANEQGHSEGKEFALHTSKGDFWFEISLTRKIDPTNAEPRFIVLSRNVTQRKASEEEINKLAFYDPLTNLPNRRLMVDRLRQALAISSRSGRIGALQFIDLDNFKTLNDTQGHDMGDLLLQQVAKRLTECMRQGDTVARLGGDEFVVMIEELSEVREEAAAQAEMIGEKILATIAKPYRLAGLDYEITPSIGITLYADHEQSTDELLKQADLAMYQAKAAGRNTLRFFDPAMQAVITTRVNLESDIRHGILKGEFELYYQPQINRDNETVGAEVLLRWPHPQRGMVSPLEFIPLAEDTGLILPLGNWVLETACTQLAQWAKDDRFQHLTLAVNVSARQFRQPDFVPYVVDLISYTGVNPKRLKLELTESLLVDDVEETTSKMTALKEHGVGFSLDDFGTGYSSLSYLKRLPLDQLKIDQSFVRDLMTDPNDAAIALAVITLGHSLGLAVIAEGVETQAQRDYLHAQGCDAYQGYLLGRPMPVFDFEKTLRAS